MASRAPALADGHAPDFVLQGFFSLIQNILRTPRRACGHLLSGHRGIKGKTMALEEGALRSGESKILVRRHFFVVMASTISAVVFAGFAPSFYLRAAFRPDNKLSILLHIHGAVFSTWIILFMVQAILIVRGSRAWHRRLGWFAAVIAAAMVSWSQPQ